MLAIADRALAAAASNLELPLNVDVEFGAPTALDQEPDIGEPGARLLMVKVPIGDHSTRLAFTEPHVSRIAELLPSETDPEDILVEAGTAALESAMNRFVAGIAQVLGRVPASPVTRRPWPVAFGLWTVACGPERLPCRRVRSTFDFVGRHAFGVVRSASTVRKQVSEAR